YEHDGVQYVAIFYGVGGWPGVGLVFDLDDPTAGLGSAGAFKNIQHYTQMGGGIMVFSLDGKSPYTEDIEFAEYPSNSCSLADQLRSNAARHDAAQHEPGIWKQL